ncbi:hypothetical protein NBRC10512_001979 [Rhodotorula toruloides]|uniref:RHTO0S03e11034g1_1 n=2 Tax=Rhodotorula toruloides TaxID=5286 RepID=A0A061ALX2_RHOTO|nr:choline dehydrogenase [Rhodotorula toruloides NP11]EMS26094.1 choline dehydrogenase [Rhodotorula toruloides NP11]CDR38583.1 RHTO0S03e11034g1_1 [Rhodotorula toruloides]
MVAPATLHLAALAATALSLLPSPALARLDRRALQLNRRANTTDAAVLNGQTFDYVVVGGGTTGLALASRLSQNSTLKIAVIEAGSTGDEVQDKVLAPAMAYFGGIANQESPYDWQYTTTNQSELGGRSVFWPRGKILGGSSAVNGLYMIRQSAIEQDSWGSLVGDPEGWGWDTMYPYLKKSETWTPPSDSYVSSAHMVLNQSLHGLDGPVHYSYPGIFYNSMFEWIPTLENMGLDSRDPAGGENWGAFIATSAINPTNWTRSYAKNGYLDPVNYRQNLVVLTGYQATRIVFDGTTATGVEFAASATGQTFTINASKEVILSTGVIGTPQLLQVSGVGPTDLLSSLQINVVKDLPGVGMHLTDHLSGAMTLNTSFPFSGDPVESNTTFAAEQLALWKAGDASSLYTSPNDAVAYVNLTTLMGGEQQASEFMQQIKANQSALVKAYSSDKAIQAGYNASYSAELRDIYPSAVGMAEILLSNTGTYGGYGDAVTVQIQAAIQHPLSRGTVKINSTSVFDKPLIDAGYLTHPADIQILRQAFKFARNVSQTAPLSDYVLNELSPGSAVQTDEEWDTWIRGVVSTEYHPAGTASMLPESEGGVVDNALRVYGLTGLRVIDFSIVPMSFSAHATAPAYGLAERAYDLLLSTPKLAGGSEPSTSANGSSSAAVSGVPGAASKTASAASNAAETGKANSAPAGSATAKVGTAVLVGLVGALALFA